MLENLQCFTYAAIVGYFAFLLALVVCISPGPNKRGQKLFGFLFILIVSGYLSGTMAAGFVASGLPSINMVPTHCLFAVIVHIFGDEVISQCKREDHVGNNRDSLILVQLVLLAVTFITYHVFKVPPSWLQNSCAVY